MNRSDMAKQVTKPPMKKKPNGYMTGGKKKSGGNSRNYAGGGKLDQMQASPRQQMAMKGLS